jgi:haemagglutination activity domain
MKRKLWAIATCAMVSLDPIKSAIAQSVPSGIVPDETLPLQERSFLDARFQGSQLQLIQGGAQRGKNLFHSFREFSIPVQQGAYFVNSSNIIQNILARVTGSQRSEILGTLGIINDIQITIFN